MSIEAPSDDSASGQGRHMPPGQATPMNETHPTRTTALYHVVIFQHPTHIPFVNKYAQIDHSLVHFFQEALDNIITTPRDSTVIDVWIDSPGGDAHAAYKLVLDLQHRCRMLRAIVPDRAKSAATLVMLGMDRVSMAAAAELGPLDAQIAHPGKDNVTISALDVADSFAFLGNAAFDIGMAGGAELLFGLGLPRIDVLNSVLQFSAQLLAPAASKLDPHLIHQATNQLRVTEQYAMSLLSNRRHQETLMAPTASSALVKQLVKEYPAHGYVIGRSEARKLGLPVDDAESHPRWDLMKSLHRKFLKGQNSMLQVVPDAALDKPGHSGVDSGNEADGEDNEPGQMDRDPSAVGAGAPASPKV